MSIDALQEVKDSLEDLESRRLYGEENIKLDLALLIVSARDAAGLTQKELAKLAGVTQAYIAKLESGQANPTVGHIGSVLAAMGQGVSFKPKPLLQDEEPTGERVRVSYGKNDQIYVTFTDQVSKKKVTELMDTIRKGIEEVTISSRHTKEEASYLADKAALN